MILGLDYLPLPQTFTQVINKLTAFKAINVLVFLLFTTEPSPDQYTSTSNVYGCALVDLGF